MKTKSLWLLFICCVLAIPAVFAEVVQKSEPVLLWLVIDQGGKTEFVAGDLHEEHMRQLTQAAKARGIELMFPMLDLSDRHALHEQDVAKFHWDRISAASARYNNPTILAGKLTKKGDGWTCQWQYQDAMHSQSWVATGKDLFEQFVMISQRMAANAKLTNPTAASSIPASDNSMQRIKIRVSGVNSLDAYSKIQEYLESLAMVARVELNGLLADEASFTINTDADKLSVAQAISEGNFLREITDPNSNNEYLEYRQS